MEDHKAKLAFNNSTIQIQTVRRLFELVTQKKTDAPLSAESLQPPELSLLFAQCGDPSELLASSCSDALVQLALLGHVDPGHILSGLLNALPTAKSLVGIVGALVDLMVSHVIATTESGQPYVCPYGIRSRPHPLVTVVTQRPDAWPVLLRQVTRVLRWPHASVQQEAVALLRPFLRFVLLEPPTSQQFIQLRLSLPRTLLSSSKVKDTQVKVIEFLEDAVSGLQIQTSAHLGEAVALLDQLAGAVLSSRSAVDLDAVRGRLAGHCLALVLRASPLGVDTEGLTETAARLVKAGVKSCCVARLWLLTAQLLLRTPDRHVSYLLTTVSLLLSGPPATLPRPLVGLMVLPLAHVTSAPPGVRSGRRAGRAARLLQEVCAASLQPPQTEQVEKPCSSLCITPEGAAVDIYLHLAADLDRKSPALAAWLDSLQVALQGAAGVPDHVTLLVAGACIWGAKTGTLERALEVLTTVCKLHPEQAPDLLPLFIFCLGYHDDPKLRLVFLEAMPKVATHKVSVAPTLKTLQLLGEAGPLRPVSLRLVTALWRRQDRCFPYLQRMLQAPGTATVSLETGLNEGLVAKAACIRDICIERPHQHGADMLAPLSAMLNECTAEVDTVPACLALEGLVALCEAEVVDIRTVWAVLAPKLSKDSRPQVIRRVCELFSLVPSLAVNTEAYEAFKQQTLQSLWGSAVSEDSVVASAAYRALSSFSQTDFTIHLLPKAVTEEFLQTSDADDEESEPQDVPGVCFTRLLETTTEDALPAFCEFLTSLVLDEVTNLPRGVYHSALSHSTRPSKDRALAAIPDFILHRHEKNKQPGFRASLAAGLLFSFDPPVESGRDGRVRRQALVSRGRTFHQMLYSLLNEVSLQPSDWHCCMSLPGAWVSFMDRCYHAYLENRRAELSLALDQGQVNDPEEHELLVATAWLWCRDKLTDLIKSASRSGPSVQANCVLALAGLALTTTQYANGLDEAGTAAAKEATEHLGHPHWLSIMTNTLMGLLDPQNPPQGRVFSLCQQHPGQSLSAASMLARGAAGLALPLLVPILLTVNSEVIQQTLTTLGNQLPGRTQNPALSFTHGLGLGALVGRLIEEQYTDVGGPQGKAALWKALLDLEDAGLSDLDNRHGCLLGLAVCLPALCKDGRAETRAYVTALRGKLTTTIESLDQKDIAYTMVSLCVAVLAVSSYVTGLLSMDPVNELVAVVYDAHCKDVCDGGLAAALGGMCHGLATAGHPTVDQLSAKLQETWVHCLRDQDLSTLHRLCALHGLLSLAGADASLFLAGEDSPERGSVQTVVKTIMDSVSGSEDPALNITAGWRLGQLYMEAASKATGNAAVPVSYQYLPETSILRPVVDRLIQAGKTGDLSAAQLKALLGCLVDGPTRPLPPLNWTAVLSPVLRLDKGDEVHYVSVKLTVRQAASAPSAALLLASAMLPPQWNNLHETCKTVILENLGSIIKSVPTVKLREFFTKSFLGLFTEGTPGLRPLACRGLCEALKVPDPPQSVTLALYQVLEQLYHTVPNEPGLYGLVGDCLREVPDHLVDSITKEDFTDATAFIKGSFTRCYLVAHGNEKLAWLNPAIEMAMWECDRTLLYNSEPKGALVALVAHCFHQYKLSQSETTSTTKLSQWLLELMGHVRSVANGKVEPPEGASLSPKTVEFGMLVWATVLVVSSDVGAAILVPLAPMTTYHPEDSQSERLRQTVMALLPHSLCNLQETEQWKNLNGKILDWLVSMHGTPVLKGSEWQRNIKACVRALRHTVDFRKMATWGPALML